MPDPDYVFAGVPDAFGRLWTPHRLAYIKGENKPSGPGEDQGCPFDRAPKLSDTEGLIVARGELVVTFMPAAGLRMQEAASTRSPAISTMQARQLPSGR